MSDIDCANLIDLSLEDDIPCTNTQIKTEIVQQPSVGAATMQGPYFVSPTWRKRDSLDNNPFDCVQKLAQRQDDPFDIVEREACLKARTTQRPLAAEVKLGNLLSLSSDNLLDYETINTPTTIAEESCLKKFPDNDLDHESPPILLNCKLPSDSASSGGSDSNPNSSSELTASSKLKKAMDRKRLLKLSLSNAAYNSPVSHKNSLDCDDLFGTPTSSMFSKAAEFGEHLLAAESPLKLIEDDIMSEEPPNFSDSEKNFEADLEMLKIPILNELSSPAVALEEPLNTPNQNKSTNLNISPAVSMSTTLSNLEAIKAKLKAKREETNNNHQLEITSLIHNLKSLIASGEMPNNLKKQQASDLLESLSSALSTTITDETLKPQDFLSVPTQQPQPIKRQGTFDIDLQENEDKLEDEQPLVEEMPNCMISSSATYDGETEEEKHNLKLPEIAPVTPQLSPQHNHQNHHHHQHNSQDHLQSDVNDIMEQLSKLLINNSSSDNHQNSNNPTFIVVMNTNNNNNNTTSAKQRSAMVASYLENSFNDGSPDLSKVNLPMARRRSQSLSIHDKVKIVQLPLKPPKPCSIQKQHPVQLDESPPVMTPPSSDMQTPEFKTPARMIRRNSYSSGTPYTAQVGVRRTGFCSDGKNTSHLRRAQTLDTHHEGQQQAIVRPLSIPANNFKPDLKKKMKHNTESIMKSTGPLKATIPVKKVAPMIKTSPPTPEQTGAGKMTSHHNTSLQNLSKTSKLPTTPGKGKSVVSAGYPNACSTPAAAFTSPLKRTGGPINKPRYSYLSATPNPKPVSSSASAAGLKRRTITEFKAKSPLKPRLSSVGLTAAAAAAAASSSKPSTGNSRLSVSAGARISKTPVKSTSNTATVRPTNRVGSRISVGGPTLSTKNKENKRP